MDGKFMDGPAPRVQAEKRWTASYETYRKVVIALCMAVSALCAGIGLRTALVSGPIWDDPTTIHMMGILIGIQSDPQQSYDLGKAWIEQAGERGAGFYGAVTQFFAHWLETVATGEPWQKVTYTVAAVMWRHLVCFLFTMCSTVGLFLAIRIMTGSRAFGIMVTAVLLSTPVFLGLSVVDEKDAPVAAGITLLSCGAALMLWRLFRNDADPDTSRWERPVFINAIAAVMIFSGTTMAFGTRVGAAALIGVECAVVCFMFLLALPRGSARVASTAAALLLSVSAGVFLATAINPLGRKSPIQWIMEGILYAAHPATQPLKLYGRTIYSGALPWWYVPGWLLAEYSAAFLALAALGIVGAFLTVHRTRKIESIYPWMPFVVQGLLLPLCIILSGAVLHDRLRHLLFIIPPLCMLAAFGLHCCVEGICGSRPRLALGVLGPAFLLINFTYTMIWYPYQYAYLSEFARTFPPYSFDVETLGLTIHEAVGRIRGLGIDRFRAGPAPAFVSYDKEHFGVIVHYVSIGYSPYRRPLQGDGAFYLHTRPSWEAAGLPGFCRKLFQIERQGVILGVGGQC